ncbi:Eukaryotic aspartyl protease family protein [Theileria parva strain Muguga]|uniref:Eukaryotic aspartyl protease family protein n=1 Tax=Theileria parva strain Muguga TaxID=333668 RepID=UPI001C61D8F7|nr:Eukaryotic aspartyl protease family protein [Theileria parva strain Muguga]KAF5153116.1 Eukaryotic aspartyl protease family protein [Theileria parva strain Muguga]
MDWRGCVILCVIWCVSVVYGSQLKSCNDCNWSTKHCKSCLHEGNQPQMTIGLRRYEKERVSVIELARENQKNFKNGKISFVLRSQGPFGSLGHTITNPHTNTHTNDLTNTLTNSQTQHSVRRKFNRNMNILKGYEYVPLQQIKDSLYVGTISVGTPPQILHPIFDTGSTNVWVVGTTCESETCKKVKRFNPKLSNTFKRLTNPKKIHIKFGTGEIEGRPASDVITVGDMSFEQNFALVDLESDSNVFQKINFEGIVGLAFAEMSSISGPSVLENIFSLNRLSENEFAFYIGGEDALLMFGGADPRFYEGELKMFPVVREHYWEVALDAIYLGNTKICCNQPSYVIFDSGTSLNSVPSAEFHTFTTLIQQGCKRGEDMTLRYILGGEEIRLGAEEYIYVDGDECIPGFMQLDVPSEFGHAYVLGSNTFMQFYFTLFRHSNYKPSMVGLARAKRGPEVSKLAKELALKSTQT